MHENRTSRTPKTAAQMQATRAAIRAARQADARRSQLDALDRIAYFNRPSLFRRVVAAVKGAWS